MTAEEIEQLAEYFRGRYRTLIRSDKAVADHLYKITLKNQSTALYSLTENFREMVETVPEAADRLKRIMTYEKFGL
jgi:hypothetical protein